MTQTNQKITCKHCGLTLTGNHGAHCPSCGKDGKIITVIASGGVVVEGSGSIETVKTFYQKNPKVLTIVILITIVSPFIGLFLIGPPGVLIGLILGALSFFLGPKAAVKVIEKASFHL